MLLGAEHAQGVQVSVFFVPLLLLLAIGFLRWQRLLQSENTAESRKFQDFILCKQTLSRSCKKNSLQNCLNCLQILERRHRANESMSCLCGKVAASIKALSEEVERSFARRSKTTEIVFTSVMHSWQPARSFFP